MKQKTLDKLMPFQKPLKSFHQLVVSISSPDKINHFPDPQKYHFFYTNNMRQNQNSSQVHIDSNKLEIQHIFLMIDMRKYELKKTPTPLLYIRRYPLQLYIDLVRPIHPLQYVHVCKESQHDMTMGLASFLHQVKDLRTFFYTSAPFIDKPLVVTTNAVFHMSSEVKLFFFFAPTSVNLLINQEVLLTVTQYVQINQQLWQIPESSQLFYKPKHCGYFLMQ